MLKMQIEKPRLLNNGLWILGILLFAATYKETFGWLYERYTSEESYYSHGFLIPFISGYFIYKKRERLCSVQISKSYGGLLLIGIALFVHLLSQLIYVFFLSGFSILLFMLGACLFLYGKRRTTIILAPIIYLIFMVPPPLILIEEISIPLKSVVTHSSVGFTNLLGLQSLQTGFLINLSDGVLTVGNPCSGLRSMFAFMALGAVFLIENRFTVPKSIVFLLLCIPIALFSNIMRVVSLALIANLSSTKVVLEGTIVHELSGYVVFVCGLAMIAILWRMIK